ncbi:MAG: hypothetical protein H6961_01945 [Chromatiaceae bacterium]|nr:hypothetical protein [Chromatiaceae bacterium]MCP5439952.1 hypothetical protein [Chromatiaceae bacterium]
MIGKKIRIAGMLIEIVSDDGENWSCRNVTMGEPLVMKKALIEKAIKLGQAEVVSNEQGQS